MSLSETQQAILALIPFEAVITKPAMERIAPLLSDEVVVAIVAGDGVGLVVTDKGVVGT